MSGKMTVTPTKVAIYCRVATDEEGGKRLDDQETAGRQYCFENGLTVDAVYREVASGSQYHEREELKQMRLRYRVGDIQGVVVSWVDRLSRNTTHLVTLLEEMERHNVTLYCVQERVDAMPMGKLVKAVMFYVPKR